MVICSIHQFLPQYGGQIPISSLKLNASLYLYCESTECVVYGTQWMVDLMLNSRTTQILPL